MVLSEAKLGHELLQPSASCEEELVCGYAPNITRWLERSSYPLQCQTAVAH